MSRDIQGRSYVENRKIVDGDHATFKLLCDFDTLVLALSKHTGTERILGTIGDFDGFVDRVIRHHDCYGGKH